MDINMTINYNFEWDPNKASSNLIKHGVTFDEAATIFKDSKAISIFDPDHSEDEERWLTLGISDKGKLLVVVHTFREEGDDSIIIRIISGRKATKKELKTYGE
jgi:uncharacterized protein